MSVLTAAQLLDELMGRDRDLLPDQKSEDISWDSPKVCKYYLCSFCPHELFINTRSDLGPCEKIHDDALKREYERNPKRGIIGYEEDFLHYLQQIMADVDRRIRRGHARLVPPNAAAARVSNIEKNEESVAILSGRINDLVEQVEHLGCEGKVEEAQGVMKLCEQLKDEREQLKESLTNLTAQEKQMEVCDVCGAFLIVGDAQSRVDDHLMGKQHMGYAKIKATIEELKNKNLKVDVEREEMRRKEREAREVERASEREERTKRQEERERERKKERESKRSRSRDRDRKRSRSRERRRSRSRERRRRRSRSRDRSSRDRSSRDRRSRSRDRRRSRSRDRYRHSRRRSRSRDRDRDRYRSRSKRSRSRSPDRKHRKERSDSPRKESVKEDTSKKEECKNTASEDNKNEEKITE